MNRRFFLSLWCIVLTVVASPLLAQAPLGLWSSSGFTDKAILMDSAWFRVQTPDGYRYSVLLDGRPVPPDATNVVNTTDYHELLASCTNITTGAYSNRLIRFIIVSSQRSKNTSNPPETGLIPWTPYPPINSTASEFAGAQLHVVAPRQYPMGLDIPVIAWIDDAQGHERRANGMVTAPGFESQAFLVRRGWGFGYLNPVKTAGTLNYDAQLCALSDPKQIDIEASTTWTRTNGILSGNLEWPENSRIFLTAHLTIAAGASLTIGAGTVVKINPLVNITNSGRLVLNGTTDQPVVFTSTNRVGVLKPANAWGGFLLRGTSASLQAQSAIITGAGGAASFSFSPGASHRDEQAALLVHSGAKAFLTNCYLVNQAGQVANGYNSDITYDHCLLQRAITSGEYSGGGTITINHSAVIEFPEELGLVNATIADDDYDAIYFTEGTHILMNSVFGFCKDDAIDSGSGGKGTVLVTNCWVESALHESLAWSGGERTTWTYDTVSMNSGQGIENGWSTGNNSPMNYVNRLLSLGNAVGARVGDNYNWNYNGQLYLSNSFILNNYRDIFLKTWNPAATGWNTNAWVDRPQQIHFTNCTSTTAHPLFPENQVWDPATDGWRLAHWMTTPPDAPVGIGLAVWTNRFPMTNIFNGVPVRLSGFTTNFVSVDYSYFATTGTLATGTLTFAPGETVKLAYPAGFNAARYSQIGFVLSDPVRGELTSIANISYQGSATTPQVSLAVATNRLPAYRLSEGLFVRLNTPTAEAVNLNYTCEAAGQTLASGTVTIDPCATLEQFFVTGFDPLIYDTLKVSVSNPVGATLAGLTSVTFTNLPLTVGLGVATNQAPLATLSNGLPVNLSKVANLDVSVDFRLEGAGQVLTNGTLTMVQGETSILLTLPTVNLDNFDVLRLSLNNPVRAQLGGITNVYLVRTNAAGAPRPLYLTGFDPGRLTLAWGDATYRLQQSDDVNGPWTNLVWRSPLWINPTNSQLFFRLTKP
jgi:hypothetical protein